MKTPVFTRVCAFLAIGAGVIFAANGAEWETFTYDARGKYYIITNTVTATTLKLTDDGTLSLNKVGTATELELDMRSAAMPSGLPEIKRIGSFTGGQTVLTKVYLPESAKVIGEGAFKGCTAMKYMKLPDGLESIESSALNGMSNLELMEPCIPGSVTNLGYSVLFGCSSMTNDIVIGEGYGADGQPRWVTIPYDVNWRNFVVRNCNKVKRLIFGPGVSYAPTMFFEYSNLPSLEVVDFGVNVTNFSDNFNTCEKLTNVIFRRTQEFKFRDYQLGWGRQGFHPFGANLRQMVFNGWFTFTAGSGNPFSGCSELKMRLIVPGNNVKWAAWMADEAKMTPWAKCSETDKTAYYTLYGEGAQAPVGISVAQPNGIKKFYILTDGTTYTGNTIVMGGEVRSEFGTLSYSPAPDAEGQYAAGTDVTVTFTPANSDVRFIGWAGDVGAADTNELSITVKVKGALNLTPHFEANYLVYDQEKEELTDGTWVMQAVGEPTEINVRTFQRAEGSNLDINLNKSVLNGGRITRVSGFGTGLQIRSIRLPDTVRALSGMNNDGISNQPLISPLVPDGVTNFASSTFHKYWNQKGNFRIGFATDEKGNVLETVLGSSSFDCTSGMGPKAELGPGIKNIPLNFFSENGNAFGSGYTGAMELWLGQNIASAVTGTMQNFGHANCTDKNHPARNPISVHFQGDMFDGSSGMFIRGTSVPVKYWMRFYVGAEGYNKKWQEFITNTKYVIPWDQLGDVQTNYYAKFPKGEEFGMKHPYGLTTEAAVITNTVGSTTYLTGLPANQWVFSLKTSGLVLRIQ